MADRYRRKRVRNMKRVLREHGSPAGGGCMLALVFLPFLLWTRLADTFKVDSCALVLVAGLASYAAVAYGALQVGT